MAKKLKQDKLAQLYRLLGAYENQLKDEGQGLGARTVSMVANWVYSEMDEGHPKGAPATWFEPEEKQ